MNAISMAKSEVLEVLRSGVVNFEYWTRDGRRREARGTLEHSMLVELLGAEKTQTHETNTSNTMADIIIYFDLDKDAFRSFYVDNLISIDTPTTVNNVNQAVGEMTARDLAVLMNFVNQHGWSTEQIVSGLQFIEEMKNLK